MKLSKLIDILTEALSMNGDMYVEGIVDGEIYDKIEVVCESVMYIELYNKL